MTTDTTAVQFIAHLKEENVVDAIALIKTSLSEKARTVVAQTGVTVAATFKLAEKKMMKEDDGETNTDNVDSPTDNADTDGKSDTDSVAGDDESKDQE